MGAREFPDIEHACAFLFRAMASLLVESSHPPNQLLRHGQGHRCDNARVVPEYKDHQIMDSDYKRVTILPYLTQLLEMEHCFRNCIKLIEKVSQLTTKYDR